MIAISKAIGDGLTPETAFRPAAIADLRAAGVECAFSRLPDGDFVCVSPKSSKDAELLARLKNNADVSVLVEDYTLDKDAVVKNPDKFKGEDTTGTTKDALLRLIRKAEPSAPDDYFDKKAALAPAISPRIEIGGEVLGGK